MNKKPWTKWLEGIAIAAILVGYLGVTILALRIVINLLLK